MRSAESFICEVHRRAAGLCRRADRRQILLLSVINAGLLTALLVLIGRPHRIARIALTGSSLLDESAGGYVAVAVLSFMLGAAITFFLRRYLRKYSAQRTRQEEKNHQT